jgi:hypothetical protein
VITVIDMKIDANNFSMGLQIWFDFCELDGSHEIIGAICLTSQIKNENSQEAFLPHY